MVTWVRDRDAVRECAEHEEAPMSQHTFVLSRRVGRVPSQVERALAALADVPHAGLCFSGPFERWALIGPWGSGPAERRARARLRTRRGTEAVEVEVGVWDRSAVELRLRPEANRPERWSHRRQLRYFAAAHEAVDALARAIERATPVPPARVPLRRSA
jgi:hypothetical protein